MEYVGWLTVISLISVPIWGLAWFITSILTAPLIEDTHKGVEISIYSATFITGVMFGWAVVVKILIPIGWVVVNL